MDCRRAATGADWRARSKTVGGALSVSCAEQFYRHGANSFNANASFGGVCLDSEPLRGPSQRRLCPTPNHPLSTRYAALYGPVFLTWGIGVSSRLIGIIQNQFDNQFHYLYKFDNRTRAPPRTIGKGSKQCQESSDQTASQRKSRWRRLRSEPICNLSGLRLGICQLTPKRPSAPSLLRMMSGLRVRRMNGLRLSVTSLQSLRLSAPTWRQSRKS